MKKSHLSFDADQFPERVQYTGPSAAINVLLLQLVSSRIGAYLNGQWTQLFSKDEANFFRTVDFLKLLYLRPLDSLERTGGKVNPLFVFRTRNEAHFAFDRFLLMYPQNHVWFTRRPAPQSGTIWQYLAGVNLDDPCLLAVGKYVDFGKAWLEAKTGDELKSNPLPGVSDNR